MWDGGSIFLSHYETSSLHSLFAIVVILYWITNLTVNYNKYNIKISFILTKLLHCTCNFRDAFFSTDMWLVNLVEEFFILIHVIPVSCYQSWKCGYDLLNTSPCLQQLAGQDQIRLRTIHGPSLWWGIFLLSW